MRFSSAGPAIPIHRPHFRRWRRIDDLNASVVRFVRNLTAAILTIMIRILAPAAETRDTRADTSQQAAQDSRQSVWPSSAKTCTEKVATRHEIREGAFWGKNQTNVVLVESA